MQKIVYSGIYFLFFLLLMGCSSGRKALEKGNYDKAVVQAVKRLRSNSDHKKSRLTLSQGYPYAVEAHQNNINRAKASNDPLKWESIVGDYQYINYLYDEISRCPGCKKVIPRPVKNDTELANAQMNAAQVRYDLGIKSLAQKQNRSKAIEAHEHFLKASSYVSHYKDVDEKLQEALYHAILRVVVEPIPSPSRMFNLSHEFFVNKINEYLHNTTINGYVRFYTPNEVRSQDLEFVDHIIRMEFDRFALGNVFSKKTIRQVSKDSVLLSTRDSEQIYGTVKAKITEREKGITGSGRLDFKIYDNELKKVISQEKFPSEYTWAIHWATFNGDERALSEEDLIMVKQEELSVPGPQWMFEQFTAPLYDQIIAKIRTYYRRY